MSDDYVTNEAWPAGRSRPDTIDEIADQFERAESGAAAFWTHLHDERTARAARLAPNQSGRLAG